MEIQYKTPCSGFYCAKWGQNNGPIGRPARTLESFVDDFSLGSLTHDSRRTARRLRDLRPQLESPTKPRLNSSRRAFRS